MKTVTPFLWLAFTSAAALTLCASAVAATPDESAIVGSTVEAFHNALTHGDGKAAMNLLAPEAVILESGSAESRADYEREHLPEDINFARTVRSVRSDVHVEINGDTAWLTSHSKSEGTFEGKPINSAGVELVVLTKTAEVWRIRAIHWSSHKAKTD
jgi:ketosteroid isomerase-like protein